MRRLLRQAFLIPAFICILNSQAMAMVFLNGDFEIGNLTGFFQQEDFFDVPSSSLISVVDDGSGSNFIAQMETDVINGGFFITTLGQNIGQTPLNAEFLSFDFRVLDNGADSSGGVGGFIDALTISFLTDQNALAPILEANSTGFTVIDPSLTQVDPLSNGFFRARTDISAFRGFTSSTLFLDFLSEDDGRLSLAQFDNLAISGQTTVVPEPATMILFASGILFSARRKKFLQA